MTARILANLEIADGVVRAIGEEHVPGASIGARCAIVHVEHEETAHVVGLLDLTWIENFEVSPDRRVGVYEGRYFGTRFEILAGPRDPLAYCQHETHPGSRYVDPEPPTLCGEDATPGTDYCTAHLGLHDPDLAESILDDDEDDVVAYLNGANG